MKKLFPGETKPSRTDYSGSLGNKIWGVVVYLAVALPFVAFGYELARTNWISALVLAAILLAWALVMVVAWSQKPPSETAVTTSQPVEEPENPTRRDAQIHSDQQARRV